MRVEDCSLALLSEILPNVDPDKHGVCIDVGVGTFAFYCELFANLGFRSIAIEPVPTKKLRRICQDNNITLIQSCLSDTNDIQTLYIGKFAGLYNSNLNSLSPDWFGSSYKEKQVNVIDLPRLLKRIKPKKITCMKLDIEGSEVNVLKQFIELSEYLKPQIVMFEYGGGSRKSKAKKGWSTKI
ncbi:FkbM family methyltransferase, partial [Anaplasma marginale]|uniref:FkbM family methyltransferase n=1 Tax=Anaplasma marginale TaxID=770 RepID=UPI0005B4EB13